MIFLKIKSTFTILISYLAHICLSVCSQRQVCVICCDVSNAPDLVPHTLVSPHPWAQQPISLPRTPRC